MKIDKYYHLYGKKDDVVFEEIPAPFKWIPVSERLPLIENNNAKIVLVTTSWGLVSEAYYCVDYWEISDIPYKLTSVVAWKPLPEPYKGGDAE